MRMRLPSYGTPFSSSFSFESTPPPDGFLSKNRVFQDVDAMSEKSFIMGPPPAYSEDAETSGERIEQKGPLWSWPPGEVSKAFLPLPPYPAGPNLSNVRYPREVYGLRYQCPECEKQFFFHRLMGIVVCPFCQQMITVGQYNKKRSFLYLCTGGMLLLCSAVLITLYFILFPKQPYVLISVMIAIVGFVMLIKAAHTKNQYQDAIRIDQS